MPTSEEVNKNIESNQYNHSIKTSLQAETSRVSGVLKFKAIKAKVDCRRKKYGKEENQNFMFDEWQKQCSRLLETPTIKSDNYQKLADKNIQSFKVVDDTDNSDETCNKKTGIDEEQDKKTSKVKKIQAKVDSRRKKWSKKQHNLMFEEWRNQRGFKWDQNKTETKKALPNNNRYQVRIYACIRFNKCAVLYTHAD